MKFILFTVIFIITFTFGYSIRCYQCIQGFPAVTDDSTIENVPLPKNLSLPGVDHLPTAYCKTPFELKGNILCTAAHRCMKSVTYEKDNKFIIRYCAPMRNEYGFEVHASSKKPVDITNGCHKFRAYICDTDLCNGSSKNQNFSILILLIPFLFYN
ncbi:uncharacterized protein LOC122510481 isoform X1 [Leptopilina heterotoma]|uniref:uncharacterized protein LOC122510481 isoform X1 n=1 Tax=Leptopilina heterotoma TaxID=63436 RepID=UPI001CA9D52C|nr:uncharacterized protein LOC122510481 isoform X1 [Leptopilina heterotoma]XP_043481101.1 uncharacterized protein LOC122510481 isoform X1 [Leptopilina heterotoma]